MVKLAACGVVCGVESLAFGLWGLVVGVCGLGFGLCGFGVWGCGLGFGIWVLAISERKT